MDHRSQFVKRAWLLGAPLLLWASLAQSATGNSPAPATATASLSGRVALESVPKGTQPSASVVYVVGFEEAPSEEVVRMGQKNKAFEPDVLAVTRGQRVEFSNRDALSHNVFSVSPSNGFDTGITPPGDNPTVRLGKPGVVDVYCNIHPEMAGNVLVVPNRAFALTRPDGSYRIEGVPAGEFTVYVWNRLAKPGHKKIKFEAGKQAELSWKLKAEYAPAPHLNKYGRPYRQGGKY
jgi:plastocyanin